VPRRPAPFESNAVAIASVSLVAGSTYQMVFTGVVSLLATGLDGSLYCGSAADGFEGITWIAQTGSNTVTFAAEGLESDLLVVGWTTAPELVASGTGFVDAAAAPVT
jgi:hypothetical protein